MSQNKAVSIPCIYFSVKYTSITVLVYFMHSMYTGWNIPLIRDQSPTVIPTVGVNVRSPVVISCSSCRPVLSHVKGNGGNVHKSAVSARNCYFLLGPLFLEVA